MADKDEKNGLNNGTKLLFGPIDTAMSKEVCEFIFAANLNYQKTSLAQITLIINSPGGQMADTFAIIDTMNGSKIPVWTVGLGIIASGGFMIFINGEQRILTPNTLALSHVFSGGSYGKEHELMAGQKQFDLVSKNMIEHYKRCTGLSEEKIREKLLPKEDLWLTAKEMKSLNCCDKIKDLKFKGR